MGSTSLALVLTKVPVVDSGNSVLEYTGTLVTVYCVPDDTSSVWSRKGDQTSSSISSSTDQCTQGRKTTSERHKQSPCMPCHGAGSPGASLEGRVADEGKGDEGGRWEIQGATRCSCGGEVAGNLDAD